MIGWIGVALTGSDTSSNALFGQLQVTAANATGLSPVLMAAANSSAGVLGKMLSLQNLAVAAAAVGLQGAESVLFRKLIGWSLGLLVRWIVAVVTSARFVHVPPIQIYAQLLDGGAYVGLCCPRADDACREPPGCRGSSDPRARTRRRSGPR
ncbi:hypothetical protein JF66_14905 [Cryobacterium sp. MLB-32]|nr:hypothetical protein JF66_14905 [Cryobacterium sp. MLB-32]